MISSAKSIGDVLGRDPVHPFPARMAASVALGVVSRSRTRLKILDPMMGSGTVLAVAQSKGHYTRGVDIDPLAVLIGRVWMTPINKNAVRRQATKVLEKAKTNFDRRKKRGAYPLGADDETKRFARYWFDYYARRQLASLSRQIRQCRNRKVRNVLWCAFSRLIITKQAGASLALDLSHSRPHKFFETAPKKPFATFSESVDQVLRNCLSLDQKKRGPQANISIGDARNLRVRSNSIDVVLTSPPYLNAIDYMRCSKFSLIWMGKTAADVRRVRAKSIGTEVGQYDGTTDDKIAKLLKSLRIHSKLSLRHRALLRRFIEDMGAVIRETARVLAPGGKAIFVIGENEVRGTYVRNSKIISILAADVGLRLRTNSTRTLPPNRRYLPPPTERQGTLNGRMRKEVVLAFSKPK